MKTTKEVLNKFHAKYIATIDYDEFEEQNYDCGLLEEFNPNHDDVKYVYGDGCFDDDYEDFENLLNWVKDNSVEVNEQISVHSSDDSYYIYDNSINGIH